MTVVKSALTDEARKIVGDALQGTLVDLLDLSLIAKQVHWNVIGPRFRSIHLQLDDVVATSRSHADTVAERASALGISPDGRAETVAKTSGVKTVADGWIDDKDVVDVMIAALGSVVARMRERIQVTDVPDPVTQDILIDVCADLEKHQWMFQAENTRA